MITVYGYIGSPSAELRAAAASAQLVVGGQRHLDALDVPADKRVVLGRIGPAVEALMALPDGDEAVVIASGDPLFYGVVRRIRAAGLACRVVPALSSLQLAFAAVALPWDDALLVSAHGNDPAPALAACRTHPKVAVLTDPKVNLAEIVDATAGLGRWYVLAERLGEADEQVRVLDEGQARAVTEVRQPNVVLVLAHHPDDPAALGEQTAVVGEMRAGGEPRGRTPVIGQVASSTPAQARADQIDAIVGSTRRYTGSSAEGLAQAWGECDLIVSHLALGATTRLIAPLLADKKTDPGVVVVDEAGSFVVPLVGGHVGGANELARQLAEGLAATAVLTTATDARGLPGLDTLGWDTAGELAGVTRAILDGQPVALVRERPWPLPALPENVTEPGVERLERRGTHVKVLPPPPEPVARVVVSDQAEVPADLPTVVLHPKSLVVGMGCNRGTEVGALRGLLHQTLAVHGLALASVAALTSVDAKADEAGLIELAAELGVGFVTYPAELLAGVDVPNPSQAPAAAVGTPSVAEASVLAHGPAIGREIELIVPKAKTSEATIAIGRIAPLGRLAVVGLGPGADDLMTPRARHVLRESSVVIGYRPYVAQIKALLRPGTEIIAMGMGTEETRTSLGIEKARQGRNVAIVCSGDPAIYAMASPTLEQGTEGVEMQIVPGVTAELAASAILGAPLGHDHATISLSDLHTDWAVIEKRLQACAEGDLVVALYNPRSRKRVMHLPRALEILGAHRPPTTPVAVVQDATRPGENYRVSTIAEFDPEWVDMHSIVIVGASSTTIVPTGIGGEVIVTPRDYKWLENR